MTPQWSPIVPPGSESVACMDLECDRCSGAVCSCRCHPGRAVMSICQRLTIAQEEHFYAFLEKMFEVMECGA